MGIPRGVQFVFRAANERLRSRIDRRTPVDPRPVICECSDPSCMQLLDLSRAEYQGVRSQGRFVVASGHDTPEVERVVERCEGYDVVEKD